MKRVFFVLGLLFLLIGYAMINAVEQAQEPNMPKIWEQQGTISKVDIYETSKYGEVFYFELEGHKERFWLESAMDTATKVRLQKEVKIGDQVAVFFTSLKGTAYDYASAPNNVTRLEKNGEVIKEINFEDQPEPSRSDTVLYFVACAAILVGSIFVVLVIVVWLKRLRK
jgi:hypothetical protein